MAGGVHQFIPDLILCDIMMPKLDGFETCKRLKQNPQLADVPIIFMTGLSDTEHIVMGLGAGGVDYITKPIKADELIARMQVHLANARITQSARAALDTAGQYLLTINAQGHLVWATPQVYQLLDNSGATQDSIALTPAITQQLRDWISHKPETGRQLPLQQVTQELSVEMLNLIDGKEYLFEGIINGTITTQKSGANGFGYDPIFVADGYNKTFSELTMEEKSTISHRGIAVKQLLTFLQKLSQ